MTQQALIFPFEFTTSTRDFSINYDGGGASAQTMTLGACGSVLSAVWKLNALLAAENANLSAYINTSHRVVINSDDAEFTVAWTDPAMGTLFGFRDDLSVGASQYVADDPPKFLWLPDYDSFDVDQFKRETRFQGARASDGSNSGVTLTPSLYKRKILWAANSAANVFETAAVTVFSFGGLNYPQEERCLEYLLDHSLSAFPQEDTAEGLSIKGVYWVPDIAVFEGASPTIALTQTWDGGGIQFSLDTNPDRYVFCSAAPSGWDDAKADLKTSTSYYTVGVELTACPGAVPSWNAP